MRTVVDIDEFLPVELLSSTLDFLEIVDLLYASHVSQRWRAAARRSRTFWGDIKLLAFSESALDFFSTRLSSSQRDGVDIKFTIPEAPDEVFGIVAGEIRRHLRRATSLILVFSPGALLFLPEALDSIAPQLKSCHITVIAPPGPEHSTFMPTSYFSGQAEHLEELILEGISFSHFGSPPAMPRLRHLRLESPLVALPSDLFTCCPRLELCDLTVEHDLVDALLPSQPGSDFKLVLSIQEGQVSRMRDFIEQVHTLFFIDPCSAGDIRTCLEAINGALRLQIYDMDGLISLRFKQLGGQREGYIREFPLFQEFANTAASILRCLELEAFSNVTDLYLDSKILSTHSSLGHLAFPQCWSLYMTIGVTFDLSVNHGCTLSLPKLDLITFKIYQTPALPFAPSIRAFVAALIPNIVKPPEIRISES